MSAAPGLTPSCIRHHQMIAAERQIEPGLPECVQMLRVELPLMAQQLHLLERTLLRDTRFAPAVPACRP
jgi:hypothetical protein